MTPKLVVLTWADSWVDGAAEVSLKDVHETHKPWVITTVGWLLLQDGEGVSLANEKTGPDSYRGRTFVPAGDIISIKPYRSPRKPRRAPDLGDPEPAAGTRPD